jgi:hypothetical protein
MSENLVSGFQAFAFIKCSLYRPLRRGFSSRAAAAAAAASQPALAPEARPEALTVAALKVELFRLGLHTSGLKALLVERLKEARAGAGAGAGGGACGEVEVGSGTLGDAGQVTAHGSLDTPSRQRRRARPRVHATETHNLKLTCEESEGRLEHLLEEWNHPTMRMEDFTHASRSLEKVPWKCGECGAEWNARITNRTKSVRPTGCPTCNRPGPRPRKPIDLRAEEVIQKLRRKEERVAKQSSKYTGVSLVKKSGRWEAKCRIGVKTTSLGTFGSEEEGARAWDRMQLWRCKADGMKKEEVKLNFPFSDYSDDEVTTLQGLTEEEMLTKLRRADKAVEPPASPRSASVKRRATGVGPANFAISQPPGNNRRGTLRARTKRTHAEVDSDADADDDYEDEADVEEEEEEGEEPEEVAEATEPPVMPSPAITTAYTVRDIDTAATRLFYSPHPQRTDAVERRGRGFDSRRWRMSDAAYAASDDDADADYAKATAAAAMRGMGNAQVDALTVAQLKTELTILGRTVSGGLKRDKLRSRLKATLYSRLYDAIIAGEAKGIRRFRVVG